MFSTHLLSFGLQTVSYINIIVSFSDQICKQANKLGLNWVKLSSTWNWDLLYYIDDYKLSLHITEHNKSVNLVTST